MPLSFGRAPRKPQQLLVGLVFGQHPVGQVGPIEAGDIAARFAEFEQRDDVVAHALRGGRGQRHDRHFGKMLPQLGKLAVLGSKIVSPFTDAVGFVHGQQFYVPP